VSGLALAAHARPRPEVGEVAAFLAPALPCGDDWPPPTSTRGTRIYVSVSTTYTGRYMASI
jgi:hypothetical protein